MNRRNLFKLLFGGTAASFGFGTLAKGSATERYAVVADDRDTVFRISPDASGPVRLRTRNDDTLFIVADDKSYMIDRAGNITEL